MSVYTKKGDKGKTGLFSTKKRISKSSLRINAIGSIDETNSFLGVIISFLKGKKLKKDLLLIQEDFFEINAILAGSNLKFDKNKTKRLETKIDEIEKKLPKLRNFIFPGGEKVASMLFYARTLVRRSEREIVKLSEKEKIRPQILMYVNRLSDYFFTLARKVNYDNKTPELKWNK